MTVEIINQQPIVEVLTLPIEVVEVSNIRVLGNSLVNLSTSEQLANFQDLDGRPVYQKSFDLGIPIGASKSVNLGLTKSQLENVVRVEGVALIDGEYNHIPAVQGSNVMTLHVEQGATPSTQVKVVVLLYGPWSISQLPIEGITATVFYTKSAD